MGRCHDQGPVGDDFTVVHRSPRQSGAPPSPWSLCTWPKLTKTLFFLLFATVFTVGIRRLPKLPPVIGDGRGWALLAHQRTVIFPKLGIARYLRLVAEFQNWNSAHSMSVATSDALVDLDLWGN
ncbi:hypothetical protein Sjap_020197 [Stephania japonica]|uniref:Uncharacterized protein n=1 Tax=Stephania japonica TaxID=461633 RepID=A0AAP0HVE3_9MAGN